ncbi:MAG: sugar phosphate isomerase/epimerase family protein [Bacteroidota bacterium]
MKKTRRNFLIRSGKITAGIGLFGLAACGGGQATSSPEGNAEAEQEAQPNAEAALFFGISLAQWSLHNTIFSGKLDPLDFAATTKKEFGIDAVEYVNQFFKDKASDTAYLTELKKRADDNGVKSLLIMIDGEGGLGDTDDAKRKKAVENHFKWVDAAKFLGCHSIRVNAYGEGTSEEVAAAAIDGLGSLAQHAAGQNINVIVENHGGYSSDGKWLSGVMKQVNLPNCGTLPDFGNFCIKRDPESKEYKCLEEYDRYQGVNELMPFAKAVSAKTHDFNDAGDEIHTDYAKMLQIVKDAGYTGYIGIEYEGSKMGEFEGIKASKALMERAGRQLASG